MEIVKDSKKILKSLYNLLNDNSYSLVVEISINDFASKHSMTIKYLNLCLWYLADAGYIEHDRTFSENTKSKQITLTYKVIELIENTI